jgi:tetratricopeptide (TPR) repeat protein
MIEKMHGHAALSCSAALALALLAAAPWTSASGASCEDWHAQFLSIDGGVEIQRAGSNLWDAVATGDRICGGDTVRVPSYGQATVAFPDASKMRLKHDTTTTFESTAEGGGWLVRLLRGALHVISRDPRELRFSTPFANAGLEGTEFLIEAGDAEMSVAVVEGEVVVDHASGNVRVLAGEQTSAATGRAPATSRISAPLELSRWAAYYPAILDGPLPGAEAEPDAAGAADPAFFTARAARRMSYGRQDAAANDLERALALAPADATARALLAVLALSRGELDRAEQSAREAIDRDPGSAPAALALAYAQRSAGDLRGARETLRRMATAGNPLVWSHLAELELASGDLAACYAAAHRALSLRPALAHAHAVLGFAALAELDSATAVAQFERAVNADSDWPLPRLGLGLTLVKQGRIAEGREHFERAVIVDPTNATARSYMAKAYDLENRSELSRTQLDIAKQIDPADPTPWYYGSLHRAAINRPVAALGELQTAIDLNDGAAVHRSRLEVDEDLASRSAGVAQIYRDLGFDELALLHGAEALARDPADYSALRLMTGLFGERPRHEIARANAAFRAGLLQPVNVTPIPPRLAEANLFIVDEAGPADLTIGEFSPLLVADGLKLRASAVGGGRDIRGTEIVLAGLHDDLSYNVGHFSFASDGFRVNNDIDQEVDTAFLQYRLNGSTSVQAELRSSSLESGDLVAWFDQNRFQPSLRQTEDIDSVRIGMRLDASDSGTFLGSLIFQNIESTAENSPLFLFENETDGYTADLQHLHRGERWTVTSGLMHFEHDRLDDIRQLVPAPAGPVAVSVVDEYEQRQSVAYGYAQLALARHFTLTAGGSVDIVKSRDLDTDRFNPKLGLVWEPTPRTTVRAAAFRTLQGPLSSSKQNIQPRLEPFQIAGFNQFFVDREGDEADVRGAAIDHQFSERLFVGSELVRRDLDALFYEFGAALAATNVTEHVGRAYAYWALSREIGLSAELQRERIRDTAGNAFLGMVDVRALRIPLEARYFHRSGFRAALRASYFDQEGYWSDEQFGGVAATQFREDQFWILDASLGYRLPNRRGMLSLHVDNALDEDFSFQELDPLNQRIAPERIAYFRFTLAFE